MHHGLRRLAFLVIALLLVAAIAACGGDDDDDDDGGGDSTPTATATATATEAGDDADDDDGDDDSASSDDDEIDFGDGLVVVTIGNDTFEFDMSDGFNVCRDVFGGLQFAGNGTDGRDTDLSGWIPPANWESFDDDRFDPPGIEVENKETNNQWTADAERAEFLGIPAGTSQVDTFEIDGLRASGTATFTDTFAIGDSEPVQGTFEISCE